jgi:chaperonin GroEL
MEEGIVPGGAITLLDISQMLDLEKVQKSGIPRDEVAGYGIMKEVLEVPFKTLIRNSGFDPGELIAKAREVSGSNMGFDINRLETTAKAEPVNMYEAGIVDPAKVVKDSLRNAASVATMVLTTECLIADKPEKTPPAGPAMPGGMGGMDY